MNAFPQLKQMTAKRRKTFVEKLLKENQYIAEFQDRFRYMNQFMMLSGLKVAADEFGYTPEDDELIAVGYRIHPSTLIAEHAAWLVTDELKLKGITICDPVANHGYFGVVITKAFYQKHGPHTFNIVLGNLRHIQSLGFKNYYA